MQQRNPRGSLGSVVSGGFRVLVLRNSTFLVRLLNLRLPKRFGFPALAASVMLLSMAGAVLLTAYNPEQDNVNGPVADRWQNKSVSWELNATAASNVDTGGANFAQSVKSVFTNSFATWTTTKVNGQLLNSLTMHQGPNTGLTDPDFQDCVNIVSFVPSSSVSFPTGTIAFTQIATVVPVAGGSPPFTYNCTSNGQSTQQQCNVDACIADADIVFNPAENFSTTTTPVSGDFDAQSVATHEIGHMLGLDHSGLAGTVMDPFGDTGSSQQRNLALDDAIGMAFLYPGSAFATATGVISGTITRNAVGIFGSHVIAVNAANGVATVDGLTDTQGNYSLTGLPPGDYNVLAVPLTGPSDITNFGGWYCGFSGNSEPCCDPSTDSSCSATQAVANPTNYTGKFY